MLTLLVIKQTFQYLPLLELWVDDPAGETLTTDTDSLKYTVTLKLVQDKMGVNNPCNDHKRRIIRIMKL